MNCPICGKDLHERFGAYHCADQVHCQAIYPMPERFIRLEEGR